MKIVIKIIVVISLMLSLVACKQVAENEVESVDGLSKIVISNEQDIITPLEAIPLDYKLGQAIENKDVVITELNYSNLKLLHDFTRNVGQGVVGTLQVSTYDENQLLSIQYLEYDGNVIHYYLKSRDSETVIQKSFDSMDYAVKKDGDKLIEYVKLISEEKIDILLEVDLSTYEQSPPFLRVIHEGETCFTNEGGHSWEYYMGEGVWTVEKTDMPDPITIGEEMDPIWINSDDIVTMDFDFEPDSTFISYYLDGNLVLESELSIGEMDIEFIDINQFMIVKVDGFFGDSRASYVFSVNGEEVPEHTQFYQEECNTSMEIVSEQDLQPGFTFHNGITIEMDVQSFEDMGTLEFESIEIKLTELDRLMVENGHFDIRKIGTIDQNPIVLIEDNNKCFVASYVNDDYKFIYGIESIDEISLDDYTNNCFVETEELIVFALDQHVVQISKETGEVISHKRFPQEFIAEEFVISSDGRKIAFLEWQKGFYVTDLTIENCYVKIERDPPDDSQDGSMARYPIFDYGNSDIIYVLSQGYEWSFGVYKVDLNNQGIKKVLAMDEGHSVYSNNTKYYSRFAYGPGFEVRDLETFSKYSFDLSMGHIIGNSITSPLFTDLYSDGPFKIADFENRLVFQSNLSKSYRLDGYDSELGIYYLYDYDTQAIMVYKLDD